MDRPKPAVDDPRPGRLHRGLGPHQEDLRLGRGQQTSAGVWCPTGYGFSGRPGRGVLPGRQGGRLGLRGRLCHPRQRKSLAVAAAPFLYWARHTGKPIVLGEFARQWRGAGGWSSWLAGAGAAGQLQPADPGAGLLRRERYRQQWPPRSPTRSAATARHCRSSAACSASRSSTRPSGPEGDGQQKGSTSRRSAACCGPAPASAAPARGAFPGTRDAELIVLPSLADPRLLLPAGQGGPPPRRCADTVSPARRRAQAQRPGAGAGAGRRRGPGPAGANRIAIRVPGGVRRPSRSTCAAQLGHEVSRLACTWGAARAKPQAGAPAADAGRAARWRSPRSASPS